MDVDQNKQQPPRAARVQQENAGAATNSQAARVEVFADGTIIF